MSFADWFLTEECLVTGLIATVCGDVPRARDVQMRFLSDEGITADQLAQVDISIICSPVMTLEDTFDAPARCRRDRKGGYVVTRQDGRRSTHDAHEVRIMRCRFLLCEAAREQRAVMQRRQRRLRRG